MVSTGSTDGGLERFADLRPLAGGWSGETFLAETPGQRVVVRIYGRALAHGSDRGEHPEEVDAALLRLVRGLVPVPEVLEVRGAVGGMPALLVTSYLPGMRADELLPGLGADGLARVGAAVGRLLADLGGMPMVRPGPFVDAELRIGSWGDLGGLPEWVDAHAERLGLSGSSLRGLRDVATRAQDLLDTVDRVCLVHSDVNPKNLLLDREGPTITGLLDWEYAHAGLPYTDLGNVLRFEREPSYVDAVLSSYCERRDGDPGQVLDLARAADLRGLIELAGRRGENPVADRAHRQLTAIARSGSVHSTEP